MKKITFLSIIAISVVVGLAAACSSDTPTTTTTNKTNAVNQPAANTAPANAAKTDEDIPASVKAAFADAQTFTKQHKDIPANSIAEIEKDTGAKVPDTDHHSYLAFSTTGGARKQLGAATRR